MMNFFLVALGRLLNRKEQSCLLGILRFFSIYLREKKRRKKICLASGSDGSNPLLLAIKCAKTNKDNNFMINITNIVHKEECMSIYHYSATISLCQVG